jgi:prevent-host-death family protein
MATVGSRELRNNTKQVLDRVEGGEVVVITVAGRPVAEIHPIQRRPRWMSTAEMMRDRASWQADPGLAAELRDLLGDETTDDLPL